ncbi:tetratricopeptide repeat protein [candidate division KSB1 bacterium]|nr:tetratricopeptide repeat protein [candidate division KSB1 bacterium]
MLTRRVIFIIIILLQASVVLATGEGTDFLYAKRLYDDGMYDLAAQQFHEFSEKYPESKQAPEALFLAGDCYSRLSKHDLARKEWIYLILSFPEARNRDEAQYRIAESYRSENAWLKAAEAYQQVIVFYPKSSRATDAALDAANMFTRAGADDRALELYFDFIEDHPNHPKTLDVYLLLARSYWKQGKDKLAEKQIEKIMDITKEGDVRAEAMLLQADIYIYTNKLDEAETLVNNLIKTLGKSASQYGVILGKAYLTSGLISREKGNYQLSNKALSNELVKKLDANGIRRAQIMMGDNYIALSEYSNAVKQFEAAITDSSSLSLLRRVAWAYEMLNDYVNAVQTYKLLIQTCEKASNDSSACEIAYLGMARNYLQLGNPVTALDYFRQYKQHFPESECNDYVDYHVALIYEQQKQEYERALRLYYDFLDAYPTSKYADDARLGLARCYQKLENYSQAVAEYQKLLERYPATDLRDEVTSQLNYLQTYKVKTPNVAMSNFAALIGQAISNPSRADLSYKLARTHSDDLKDYQSAKAIFSALAKDTASQVPKDEVLFYLAQCNYLLAMKEKYERGQVSSLLDTANVQYLKMIETYPDSPLTDDAIMNFIETRLAASDSVQQNREFLKQYVTAFMMNHPTSPFMPKALLLLGKSYLDSGESQIDDSLFVYDCFDKIVTGYPRSPEAADAMYLRAVLLMRQTRLTEALDRFKQFIGQHPNHPQAAQAHMLMADMYEANQDYTSAIVHLQEIVTTYFYSALADNAVMRMGAIYLKTKDYENGLKLLKNYQRQYDTPCYQSPQSRYPFEADVLFRIGQFDYLLENKTASKIDFQKFLQKFPKHAYAAQTLYYLAGQLNANQPDEREQAMSYLQRLIDDFPKFDQVAQAKVRLADLFMKQEDYSKAHSYYLAAADSLIADNDKQYARSQAIIALYKTGQVTKGDAELKQFKKDFKDTDEYEGEILIAKGDYFFREKEFQQAEEIYKDIRSDLKKTSYGPKAAHALGRLYLTLNKDEDALKILTELPGKYPDDPIIPEVYLSLGDFYYYKSRQVEHAMLAYRNAIDNPKIEDASLRRGMMSLIKCYFDLRLWDQALVLSRQYVERYPLAEDAFDTRVQIGIIYYQLKEYDRAVSYLKELKREADRENEPRIQYWIGDCYMEKGQYDQALSEYLKVKYLSKPSKFDWAVTAQYKAGLAYMKLGKMDEAKLVFQKIIADRGADSNFGKGAQKKIDEIESTRN